MEAQRSTRLVILLTKEEAGELKRRSGLVPTSVWARAVLLGQRLGVEPDFTEFKSYAIGDGAEKPEPEPPTKKNSKRTPPPTDESDLAQPEEAPFVITAAGPAPKFSESVLALGMCEHGAHHNDCDVWGCKFYRHSNGRGATKRAIAPDTPAGTRSPGGKCTYGALGGKVCPQCHKVHSKV